MKPALPCDVMRDGTRDGTRDLTRDVTPDQVLAFWFGEQSYDQDVFAARMLQWFEGGDELDRQIACAYGAHLERAAAGHYDGFCATARGSLALLLLLDQFPRHVYRGRSEAFQYDERAREICLAGLALGQDRQLPAVQRQFFYLPLQHAEHAADQEHCVALFEALLAEEPEHSWLYPHLKRALEIARFHAQVIRRYGRYPHRNALLGRPSTLAEQMYLDAGGPTFGQAGARVSSQDSAARRPEFRIYTAALTPADTVCVDGSVFGLRCLSHWPGTVAAPELRHELSTGMALAYARLSTKERERVLGRFSVVTNDHYDTDGALAAFALIAPEASLKHAELMLRTAASGDFRTWQGEAALALDLTVWALRDSARSPLASALQELPDYGAQAELCYRWLIDHFEALLADPFAFRGLWARRFEHVLADIRAVESREIEVLRLPAHDLAVVFTQRPLTRHGLVHASGDLHRVLLVHQSERGRHYRFAYRNESWFLGARERIAPRISLDQAVSTLSSRESASDGHWWCMPLEQTSPELGFSESPPPPNVFGDIRPDLDPPSALTPDQVIEALTAALQPGAPRTCHFDAVQPTAHSELS